MLCLEFFFESHLSLPLFLPRFVLFLYHENRDRMEKLPPRRSHLKVLPARDL